MKLTKILLLITIFEAVVFAYVLNIDTDKHYIKMFEVISKDYKY